ncbi:GspE/PulE family protein [Rhizobium sp. SG741]|uniref:GspE/PulE family protein n=1 Tax=Rhizobium sp. SG741 TaxID=2587114 RepID=UPI001447DD9F|nr:GspE/PulE family protein [Rhizobium sp. SG741]NKJ09002.1 general secretion pathway protein E [Rhizobium sp. SG741]
MMVGERSLQGFLTYLRTAGDLSTEAAERVKAGVARTAQAPDIVIRELGLVAEGALAAKLAEYFDVARTDVIQLDALLLAQLGEDYAQRKAIVPITSDDETIVLVIADPFDVAALNAVAYLFDRQAEVKIASRNSIEEAIKRASTAVLQTSEDMIGSDRDDDVDRLLDISREEPVIRFVSRVVQQAVDAGATDIHFEPELESLNIRLRRNGMLQNIERAPKALQAGIISRIKILAKLNIAERRLPQDGRIRLSVRGEDVDFRVSVMPSVHGETIVLRILNKTNVALDLLSLGYQPQAAEQLLAMAERPNGIILITGPTGSGKTTTLYALLDRINKPDLKIFTVEDPVEYRMKGLTQMQVDPTIGLTFAAALRSVLRQDPDVILIGEIRDGETARIAIQAALTGHLVLSTLHTSGAVGAISRLKDMGVESYLIEATLRGVVSQRLLRLTCSACHDHDVGCQTCGGTGYHGRKVAYEILEVTEIIRSKITSGASNGEIEDAARSSGMVPIRQYAQVMHKRGLTTQAEVARMIDFEVV